jgi:hypothetical protein
MKPEDDTPRLLPEEAGDEQLPAPADDTGARDAIPLDAEPTFVLSRTESGFELRLESRLPQGVHYGVVPCTVWTMAAVPTGRRVP